jgi:hypothetical protein
MCHVGGGCILRRMWNTLARPAIVCALALASALGGCTRTAHDSLDGAMTASAPAPVLIQPGEYERVFNQAKDDLRGLGFILDRVDAQLGVITTMPKGSGGILTPWDQEQSGIDDRLEDAVQKHRRVVRIDFSAVKTAGQPGDELADLRTEKGPIQAQVSVALYRIHTPGWRLNTQGILESTRTTDPQLSERGMGQYGVAIRQDDALARRIADHIRSFAAQPASP